ncbi:MAG: hypothetical protein J6Z29_02835 [Ruminococcus sp.]|nr:hypothetical protein [Ruminococcus sp.]
MASVLTAAIVSDAKSSVDTYVATAKALYEELASIINNLTSTNFIGDAADGYKEFFNSKATPALTDNLTDPTASLTAAINGLMDMIKESMLDTVDPQLGDVNRNPQG